MARIKSFAYTEAARNSAINQNSFQILDKIEPVNIAEASFRHGESTDFCQIFILAAGEGGLGIGDLGVRLIQEVIIANKEQFKNLKEPRKSFAPFIQRVLERANSVVYTQLKEKIQVTQGGCTLVGIIVIANEAFIFSLGDELIYLYRDQKLHLINKKNKYELSLPNAKLSFAESDAFKLEHVSCIKIEKNDSFFLFSKGIWNYIDENQYVTLLNRKVNMDHFIRSVISQARDKNSVEDRSIVALQIKDIGLNSNAAELAYSAAARAKSIGDTQTQPNPVIANMKSPHNFNSNQTSPQQIAGDQAHLSENSVYKQPSYEDQYYSDDYDDDDEENFIKDHGPKSKSKGLLLGLLAGSITGGIILGILYFLIL